MNQSFDTGASASVISEATYRQLWPENPPPLRRTNIKLRTYTGESLKILGTTKVKVEYQDQEAQLPLLVVGGSGPSLLGKNRLSEIRLNWEKVLHKIQADPNDLQNVLDKHTNVFKGELGLLKGTTANIHVTDGTKPRFCKARPVPYFSRDKIHSEIDSLATEGIIEPVEFADWAAPIVPVITPDGKIRICGDYKIITVNQVAKLDKYPLPRIKDLFASLRA